MPDLSWLHPACIVAYGWIGFSVACAISLWLKDRQPRDSRRPTTIEQKRAAWK
jgi:hypothetical protein